MIEAVLFTLGLVTGPFHVVVALDPSAEAAAHTIEFVLDGEVMAEVTEPPWEARFDLGDELVPHDLVVISRDASGAELDRRVHRLNSGDAPGVEAPDATPIAVLLDHRRRVPDGLPDWFEVDGQRAEVVDVTYPETEIWIVRDPKAQLELDRAARLGFAGAMGYGEVPADVLRAGRDATFDYLSQDANFILRDKHRFQQAWDSWRQLFGFEEGTEIRFVSPWGAPVSKIERPRQIFSATRTVELYETGLLFETYATRPLSSWFRLADAVGIAGLQAAGDHRRAVVMLTADLEFKDDSLFEPSQIRRLLADLGVPLFVWYIGHDEMDAVSEWGPSRLAAPSIGSAGAVVGEPGGGYLRHFMSEYQELKRTLARQRIVWLRGRHLPHEVSLNPEAEGVRLVSSVASWPLSELETDPAPAPQEAAP